MTGARGWKGGGHRARYFLAAPLHALRDAAWAFALTPWSHRHARGHTRAEGATRRVGLKIGVSVAVFVCSLRTRLARHVRIRHLPGEGFFANFLHVLEVLERVRPDAEAYVDWTLVGDEYYFRYGRAGTNVWDALFEPVARPFSQPGMVPNEILCVTYWGHAKDYLEGDARMRQRREAHAVLERYVKVVSARVLATVGDLYERSMKGHFTVGVHRRVGNVLVAALQASGVSPAIEALVARVQRVLHERGGGRQAVFLATDDAEAVERFRAAFGDRLLVRDGVKRTTDTAPEAHALPSGALTLADAEDVLIDALLLARCDVLVHASSSVTTSVSILNPELELVHA